MAIKMRTNKNAEAICDECGNGQSKSLMIYDIMIGGKITCICDKCNDDLFNKSLKAVCKVNGTVKSKHDLAVIASRKDFEIRNSNLNNTDEKYKKETRDDRF